MKKGKCMTLQEILKSQGLSDEQIEKVTGEMKQNKIFTASEENLDIRYKDLKGKYKDLKGKFDSKPKEQNEANALIEQSKKDNAGNSELQAKVTEYETTISNLKAELEQSKANSALENALIKANVVDVDYMAFKFKEKGEIKLDDKGKIKGFDDTLNELKTQYPTQFTSTTSTKIEENRLPNTNDNSGSEITKEQFNKMGYRDRLKLHTDNPELYNTLNKGE